MWLAATSFHVTRMIRIGSLFSGAGGLDMAVEQVFGGITVWHCENDPAASKVLAHRWPRVLNLDDITEVHWNALPFHIEDIPGVSLRIDVLCAGWPCQPFSLAGKRKGIEDERALWPYVARAIRALRPRYVVLENVAAVLGSPEFDRVANSLAETGYDFSWTCLRASDVGAPHRRERLFIVAHATGDGLERHDARASVDSSCGSWQRNAIGSAGPAHAANPPRDGRHEGRPESARLIGGPDATVSGAGPVELLPTPRSSDRFGAGQHGDGGMDLRTTVVENATQWGKYEPAIRRWETLTRPAPAPTEPNKNGNPRLSAAFSEWLMGWPAGHVTEVPGISRIGQLRIVGNGVVPQCAAAAIGYLLSVSEAAT